MKVLVAYASRHGSTRGIAERIAQTLERHGLEVHCKHVDDVGLIESYEAFVIGSSAYFFHWEKEASEFVRRNEPFLTHRPVWLFSSGPIGTDRVDKKGNDVLEASEPREFEQFERLIQPRDEKVFFGAYDPDQEPVGVLERIAHAMPAAREAMPRGDYREWSEIEGWATEIADALKAREPALVART